MDKDKLFEAVEKPNLGKVKELLDSGANPNARDSFGRTPLMVVSECWANPAQAKATVECLTAHGADVNAKDRFGRAALMYAVCEGAEPTKLLIQHGADINAQDEGGMTALMAASQKGHSEVVRLLLKYGADITTKDKNGWTALMYATENNQTSTARLLKHAVNKLLFNAIEKGSLEEMNSAVNLGADVNAEGKMPGITPLMQASADNRLEVMKFLIKHGANIDATDIFGGTALIHATLNGHTEAVELLLKHGADAGIKDIAGNTALAQAVLKGHECLVKTLLKHGVNPNTYMYLTNTFKVTAVDALKLKLVNNLDEAARNRMIGLLRSYGGKTSEELETNNNLEP